jgi:hypothetical protein
MGDKKPGTATVRRKTRQLISKIPGVRTLTRKNCPPGQVLRKGYTRHYSTAVRRRGFTVRKSTGRAYRIHPSNRNTYVEPRCSRNTAGSTRSSKLHGPVREGELAKHGYSFRESDSRRQAALLKAVREYTALGVYKKLRAVAVITRKKLPRAHAVFMKDMLWISKIVVPLKRS